MQIDFHFLPDMSAVSKPEDASRSATPWSPSSARFGSVGIKFVGLVQSHMLIYIESLRLKPEVVPSIRNYIYVIKAQILTEQNCTQFYYQLQAVTRKQQQWHVVTYDITSFYTYIRRLDDVNVWARGSDLIVKCVDVALLCVNCVCLSASSSAPAGIIGTTSTEVSGPNSSSALQQNSNAMVPHHVTYCQ